MKDFLKYFGGIILMSINGLWGIIFMQLIFSQKSAEAMDKLGFIWLYGFIILIVLTIVYYVWRFKQ